MHIIRQLIVSQALIFSLFFSALANAQPKTTQHLLLGSPYGEFCTMCEAFVACVPQNEIPAEPLKALPETGNFTLYYFPTRTFLQQIYTIWEWFSMMFVPMNVHNRPLEIYQPNGSQLSHSVTQTEFSIDPPKITVPDGIIQRDTAAWLDSAGQPKGQCYRLPLWDTLDAVKKRMPAAANTEGK